MFQCYLGKHNSAIFQIKSRYCLQFRARVPNVGATAHRWAMESSRGAVVDQNEFGGAEADHRPLTKINIYPKLQKNIPKI